jgi:hypothetical protein
MTPLQENGPLALPKVALLIPKRNSEYQCQKKIANFEDSAYKHNITISSLLDVLDTDLRGRNSLTHHQTGSILIISPNQHQIYYRGDTLFGVDVQVGEVLIGKNAAYIEV